MIGWLSSLDIIYNNNKFVRVMIHENAGGRRSRFTAMLVSLVITLGYAQMLGFSFIDQESPQLQDEYFCFIVQYLHACGKKWRDAL